MRGVVREEMARWVSRIDRARQAGFAPEAVASMLAAHRRAVQALERLERDGSETARTAFRRAVRDLVERYHEARRGRVEDSPTRPRPRHDL